MEKKELFHMRKHRGLFLALGLAALVGVMAPEARAAGISMTITWSGGSISFNSLTGPSTYVDPSSTQDRLVVTLQAVNAALSGAGFQFTALGANSNNPGQPNPTGASLLENATIQVTGGGTEAVTITANQAGFTIPTGSGAVLSNFTTANFNAVSPTSTETTAASYNALMTTPIVTAPPASGTGNTSPSNSLGVGTVPPGSSYSLDTTLTIDLTGSQVNSYDAGSVNAVLTAAVPEPASLLLMLTGMPLPLVVVGLLRRRAAASNRPT
jgi:hypothetical protein